MSCPRSPWRRRARLLLVAVVAISTLAGSIAPAGSSVRIGNLVASGISVVDPPTTASYWSGTSTSYATGPEWRSGTFASTTVDPKQGTIEAHLVGGAVSVGVNQAGLDRGRPWTIPGAPAATAVSLAVNAVGIAAIALVTTAKDLVVARQVAPGVWAPVPEWVTAATNASDVELAANLDDLFSATYVDATTSVPLAVMETAASTWSRPFDSGWSALRTATLIHPAGWTVQFAVGTDARLVRYRAGTRGGWGDWFNVCNTGSDIIDLTAVTDMTGNPVVVGINGTAIFVCRHDGAKWTGGNLGTGAFKTVSAARLVDGRIMVSVTNATNDLVTAVGDSRASVGSFGAWSASLVPNVTDHEYDGYDAGQDVRLASTGASTYATTGTWTSPVIDTGANGTYGLLRWRATVPTGTTVKFQVAASEGDPTNFVGPDGTAATTFSSQSDTPLPYALDGLRYLRIRATLTGTGAATPLLHVVTVNHRLPEAGRSADGRSLVTGTPGSVNWVARTTAAGTWFSASRSKLSADASSVWGTLQGSVGFDTAGPSCCAPAHVTVNAGTATTTGAAAVAPSAAGTRSGQSIVVQNATRVSATADLSSRTWVTPFLQFDRTYRATLMSNVARNGTAAMSSLYHSCCPAGKAIDGNTDGNWYAYGNATTALEAQPWWRVDLGASRQIAEIRLWNRTDCCADRLSDYVVLTSNTPIPTASFDAAAAAVVAAGGQVRFLSGTSPSSRPFLYPPGTTARYVQVMLRTRSGYLTLSEVEVSGV